jgi:hypothetical protein
MGHEPGESRNRARSRMNGTIEEARRGRGTSWREWHGMEKSRIQEQESCDNGKSNDNINRQTWLNVSRGPAQGTEGASGPIWDRHRHMNGVESASNPSNVVDHLHG